MLAHTETSVTVYFGIEENQPSGNTACGRSAVVTRDTQDYYSCNTTTHQLKLPDCELIPPVAIPPPACPLPPAHHPNHNTHTLLMFRLHPFSCSCTSYHNLRQFKIPGGTIVFRPADDSASTNSYLYDNDWDQVLHTYVVEEGYPRWDKRPVEFQDAVVVGCKSF